MTAGTAPPQHPRPWQRALFAVVAVAALLTSPALIKRNVTGEAAFGSAREGRFVARVQRALDGIRATTAPTQVLGFVTDAPEPQARYDFWLARYAVRPVQLAFAPSGDLVLGAFADTSAAVAGAEAHGLRIDQDFGGGVVLLRPRGR